ncbi:molybdopterin biosynthesis protein MoeB [Ralstonia solanacearum]|nr:molybdopterin biosynthesis protein MoeB [Ralstonia solanacearum]
MTHPTLLPADIAGMSVSDLAKLSPERKLELDANLDAAIAWLKNARAKLDAALDQCYGEQARTALRDSGRDFGTTHIADGPLRIKFECPKKVTWNQKLLTEIAERIVAAGERPEAYLDVKLSVPESRYNNWPPALQQQFADARTVEPAKPSFTLTRGEVAV